MSPIRQREGREVGVCCSMETRAMIFWDARSGIVPGTLFPLDHGCKIAVLSDILSFVLCEILGYGFGLNMWMTLPTTLDNFISAVNE
jgi:hypothetical protein